MAKTGCVFTLDRGQGLKTWPLENVTRDDLRGASPAICSDTSLIKEPIFVFFLATLQILSPIYT